MKFLISCLELVSLLILIGIAYVAISVILIFWWPFLLLIGIVCGTYKAFTDE